MRSSAHRHFQTRGSPTGFKLGSFGEQIRMAIRSHPHPPHPIILRELFSSTMKGDQEDREATRVHNIIG